MDYGIKVFNQAQKNSNDFQRISAKTQELEQDVGTVVKGIKDYYDQKLDKEERRRQFNIGASAYYEQVDINNYNKEQEAKRAENEEYNKKIKKLNEKEQKKVVVESAMNKAALRLFRSSQEKQKLNDAEKGIYKAADEFTANFLHENFTKGRANTYSYKDYEEGLNHCIDAYAEKYTVTEEEKNKVKSNALKSVSILQNKSLVSGIDNKYKLRSGLDAINSFENLNADDKGIFRYQQIDQSSKEGYVSQEEASTIRKDYAKKDIEDRAKNLIKAYGGSANSAKVYSEFLDFLSDEKNMINVGLSINDTEYAKNVAKKYFESKDYAVINKNLATKNKERFENFGNSFADANGFKLTDLNFDKRFHVYMKAAINAGNYENTALFDESGKLLSTEHVMQSISNNNGDYLNMLTSNEKARYDGFNPLQKNQYFTSNFEKKDSLIGKSYPNLLNKNRTLAKTGGATDAMVHLAQVDSEDDLLVDVITTGEFNKRKEAKRAIMNNLVTTNPDVRDSLFKHGVIDKALGGDDMDTMEDIGYIYDNAERLHIKDQTNQALDVANTVFIKSVVIAARKQNSKNLKNDVATPINYDDLTSESLHEMYNSLPSDERDRISARYRNTLYAGATENGRKVIVDEDGERTISPSGRGVAPHVVEEIKQRLYDKKISVKIGDRNLAITPALKTKIIYSQDGNSFYITYRGVILKNEHGDNRFKFDGTPLDDKNGGIIKDKKIQHEYSNVKKNGYQTTY